MLLHNNIGRIGRGGEDEDVCGPEGRCECDYVFVRVFYVLLCSSYSFLFMCVDRHVAIHYFFTYYMTTKNLLYA